MASKLSAVTNKYEAVHKREVGHDENKLSCDGSEIVQAVAPSTENLCAMHAPNNQST